MTIEKKQGTRHEPRIYFQREKLTTKIDDYGLIGHSLLVGGDKVGVRTTKMRKTRTGRVQAKICQETAL